MGNTNTENDSRINVEELLEGMTTAWKTSKNIPTGYATTLTGDNGTVETPAMSKPVEDFSEVLEQAGFSPDVFELDAPPKVKTWDAQTPDGVVRLYSYGLSVRKKREGVDVGDLIQYIHSTPPPSEKPAKAPTVGVFAVGDLQLGKSDGDGTRGIVERFNRSVENAVMEWEKNPTETVLITFLGDCIEGVVSQGGRNINNNDLTLTEQLRTLRHLMTRAVQAFHKQDVELHVASVPGNHDETHRNPVNAPPHDSFAVDSLKAVEEAHQLAGVAHTIHWHYPENNRLHITLQAGPHKFLLAHGHQWRAGKHFDWWKGMAFSLTPAQEATYMLAGHNHHLQVDTSSDRWFIQVPAMESESAWWFNKTGETGNPGAVWVVPGQSGPQQLTLV